MIDCHVHYASSLGASRLQQIVDQYGMEAIVLACIPKGSRAPTNADALEYQKKSSIPVYVLGGLSRELYGLGEEELSRQLPAEAGRLMDMGCSGIKMLEGKPNVRKEYPIPDFDQPVWEGFWTYMEREQIPILFHVNDPEEFWDSEKVTETAKQFGWFYDDTYVNNEDQYGQVLRVLERHPRLRILFPHFFFLSGQLDRLSGILDRYGNVKIDLTPGVELYHNLSARHEKAREFFDCYQDRICFGTDIGARQVILRQDTPLSLEESEARIRLVTDFLEKDGAYTLYPDGYYQKGGPSVLYGLGLEQCVKDRIYGGNIREFLNV